jgi:hypothetical protein
MEAKWSVTTTITKTTINTFFLSFCKKPCSQRGFLQYRKPVYTTKPAAVAAGLHNQNTKPFQMEQESLAKALFTLLSNPFDDILNTKMIRKGFGSLMLPVLCNSFHKPVWVQRKILDECLFSPKSN